MILALNIGNTNITFGCFRNDTLLFSAQIGATLSSSTDEYAIKLRSILELYQVDPADLRGAILGSVVPALTGKLQQALQRLLAGKIMVIGPGLKSGLPIRLDTPSQLGAELLCSAVAALRFTKPPFVIIHADTAISMMALNPAGQLVGGVIVPGPQMTLNSLVQGTAQLPQVDLHASPVGIIATNTNACLQSGMILGFASMLDGLVARFRAELGPETPAIATGVLPSSILNATSCGILLRDNLVLEGLYAIWTRNRKG